MISSKHRYFISAQNELCISCNSMNIYCKSMWLTVAFQIQVQKCAASLRQVPRTGDVAFSWLSSPWIQRVLCSCISPCSFRKGSISSAGARLELLNLAIEDADSHQAPFIHVNQYCTYSWFILVIRILEGAWFISVALLRGNSYWMAFLPST